MEAKKVKLPVIAGKQAVENRVMKNRWMAEAALAGVTWTIEQRPESGGKAPRLVPSRPVLIPTKEGGFTQVRSVALFTRTSKMACASFSLPASTLATHGTCPASNQRPLGDKDYVCYGCYATKGNYILYPALAVYQLARRAWVEQQVAAGTFAVNMAEAIRSFYSKKRLWKEPKKTAVSKGRAPLVITLDPNYFRIHDAGDFSWLAGYYEAWANVCRIVSEIKFWAPTRDWIFTVKGANLAKEATPNRELIQAMFGHRRPRNMIVRPSALYFGEKAPTVRGLDAGTTASKNEGNWVVGKKPVQGWCGFKQTKTSICRCPAYETEEANCASAHCRTCWEKPRQQVVYPRH